MYSKCDDYDDGNISDSSSIISNKFKSVRGACAICGAKPTGINFDVLTCSSCKAFFRRNGVKPLNQFVCRSNGECRIDQRSRRQCTACRLRKCFSMGMIKERIRTDEQNQRHRALVEENRRVKLKKFQQQQHENHLKILDERRRRAICSTSSSSSSCLSSNNHFRDVDLFFDLFIETIHKLIPEDFLFKFDNNLINVLNSYCEPISSFITFLKQIFQFQQLPVDDRLLLLKNNIKILLPILTRLLNTSLGIPVIIDHPGIHNINNRISYAYSLFTHIIPDDNKLLILIILVFIFCPCLFTSYSLYDAGYISEHSRKLIRCTYNQFTQTLWLYIMEKSRDNEKQAVLTYTKIVTKLLHLQNLMSEVYGIIECSVQIDRLHMIMQSILHLT